MAITMKPETIARRAAERIAAEVAKRESFVTNFKAAKLKYGFTAELPDDVCHGCFALAGREEEVLVTANGYRVI